MIDIENEVYTKFATALRTSFSDINVQGILTFTPSSFPCVCIEEIDNYSRIASRTSSTSEAVATVTYEINVFSNKTSGAKTEAKKIYKVIDNVADELGLTRLSRSITPLSEGMTYRITGRYTANVSADKKIYRS